MPTTLHSAVLSYLRSARLSRGTKAEYQTTLRKWAEWGRNLPLEELGRKEIREFLEWVHERAVTDDGTNPGRTANKAREQLRAVVAWAWDQELIDALPRFPKRRAQRDVAGRHYLTKAEINAIYFATYRMPGPKGGARPSPSAPTGAPPWCSSSTTESTPARSGGQRRTTRRSSGDTYPGAANAQTGRSRSDRPGAGSTIAGRRRAWPSTGH